MRTRGEIKTKLTPMLLATTTSTYFTPTRVETAISDANLWAGDEKDWPDVKKGFITHTIEAHQYYDYPTSCQSESIFRIMVDGDANYEKIDFEDFLKYVEENPSSTRKIWSEYGRQYFIFPTPTVTGTDNLIVWGLIQAAALDTDAATTMFTDWSDATNEAILLKAYHDIILNTDPNKANDALAKAQAIVNKAYLKIAKRKQRKHMDRPQFEVPDFFGNAVKSSKNFSIEED